MGISRRSPEEKNQIIKEALETGNSSLVARKYNVTPLAVARWVKENKLDPMKEIINKALKKIPELSESAKETKQIEEQNFKLKKLIGEKELDVLRPQREIKSKYPRKLARNRIVTAPNQLWETDIKYGFIMGEDRFFYVLSIIDVYDREIIDYHIGLHCEGQDAAATLVRALIRRKMFEVDVKPVIRSDNGPQFISHKFADKCIEITMEHERIPCKTPNMNAHI